MAAPQGRWTDERDAVLRRMHADGASPRQIAAEVFGEVTASDRLAVMRRAARLGLSFDYRTRENAQTAAGRRALELEHKERLARLRRSLLAEAEQMLADLNGPAYVFNFGGKDNTFADEVIDELPVADKLKLAQAVSTLTNTVERLERMAADETQAEAAGGLDRVADAMLAAATMLRGGQPVAVEDPEGLL